MFLKKLATWLLSSFKAENILWTAYSWSSGLEAIRLIKLEVTSSETWLPA